MKKFLLVFMSVVFTSVFIFIFSSSAFSAAKKEILVGGIVSMTGDEAMVGIEHKWAVTQAVKDINAKGGVYVKELNKKLPMKLVFADDQSNPSGASSAAEKLIKYERVDFLIGSVDTPLNINAATVAEKYKRLLVTTTFFPEMFADFKYKWVADSFFSIAELAGSSAGILDPYPEAEKPKNFAVLVEDNADGQGFGKVAQEIIKSKGYKVALYEPYTKGSKDFSSSVLKMKGAKVDAIVTLCSSADGLTFIRQMKEANFAPKYIWGARGFWPISFGESLGKDANYMVSDGHWAEALGAPGSKELGDKFRAEFGATKYSVTIGNPYSLVQALAQAIEKAGSIDNTKVRDVFYSGTFVAKDTTQGDLAFNNIGIAKYKAVALQWMDGKRMPVYPYSPSIWKLKWMPPWDQR